MLLVTSLLLRTQTSEVALNPTRCISDQHFTVLRDGIKSVGNSPGPINDSSGTGVVRCTSLQTVTTHPEPDFSGQHDPELILIAMNMQWRRIVRCQLATHYGQAATRLGGAN